MAIIKTFRNAIRVAAIFEDPQPGSDYIYFQNDAYNKSTLNPIFDKGLSYQTSGQIIPWSGTAADWSSNYGFYGFSKPDDADGYMPAGAGYFTGRLGGILQLAGETTHVRHFLQSYGILSGNTGNGVTITNIFASNNLDMSPFVSLDTNYKATPNKYFTDGTNNLVLGSYNWHTPNVAGNYSANQGIYTHFIAKINTTPNDLASSNYFTYKVGPWNQAQSASPGGINHFSGAFPAAQQYGGTHSWPLYRNPTTGNLVMQSMYFWSDSSGNAYHFPSAYVGTSWQSPLTASPVSQTTTSVGGSDSAGDITFQGQTRIGGVNQNAQGHFLGVSTRDGLAVSMHVSFRYDHGTSFYKYNDLTNTAVTLNYYKELPLPAGLGGTGQYGSGTYLISNSMTVANTQTSITGTLTGNNGTWVGRIEGNVMTVTGSMTGVGVVPGQVISGTGITAGTTVLAYTTSTLYTYGDRGTTYGYYTPKMPSKTFTDTSAITNIGFYQPRFDSTGTYQPLYFIWNKTTDFITRYPDIYITYPANTNFSTYWMHDATGIGSLDNGVFYKVFFNETFVSSTGTRHLILGKLHGAGLVYDNTSTQRSFIVYTVDPTNYKKLSFHQSFIIPSTPKNICWLNDDRTLLAVITNNATFTYYFNPYTGFQLTATFPYQYNAIGRDALGRVWAHDTGPLGYGRIHLLSGIPATISLIANTSTYNYSGTAIPTTFSLDALDLTGSRMTATVALSIAGSSLKLLTTSGSITYLTSLTTTTNTSTSTTIYGTVISNGYSSITTTLTI